MNLLIKKLISKNIKLKLLNNFDNKFKFNYYFRKKLLSYNLFLF